MSGYTRYPRIFYYCRKQVKPGFIKKLPAIKLDIIFLFLFLKEEALEQPELNVTASHVVSFSLYML